MIQLTTLGGKEIWINFDQIRFIETVPDTLICFLDGHRMTVKEKPEEIAEKIKNFGAHKIKDAHL